MTVTGGSPTVTVSDTVPSPAITTTLVVPGPRPTSVTIPSCAEAPTIDGSSAKAAVAPGTARVTTCWYSSVGDCAPTSLAPPARTAISITPSEANRRNGELHRAREHLVQMIIVFERQDDAVSAGGQQRRVLGAKGQTLAWHEALRLHRNLAEE